MGKALRKDRAVQELEAILRENYLMKHPEAKLDVYRYNSASIRIRVVDPTFAGVGLTERDDEIWKALKGRASRDALSQISFILLIAPNEATTSIMNREFENPTPSRL